MPSPSKLPRLSSPLKEPDDMPQSFAGSGGSHHRPSGGNLKETMRIYAWCLRRELPELIQASKVPTVSSRRNFMLAMDWRLGNEAIAILNSLTPGAVQYWRRKLGYTNFQHGWHLERRR